MITKVNYQRSLRMRAATANGRNFQKKRTWMFGCLILINGIIREPSAWKEVGDWIRGVEKGIIESGCNIPSNLLKMLVSAEDHRFYDHDGVDPKALVRACYRTLTGNREGGSTIAQQLARVAGGRFEKTLSRKLWEIRIAILITKEFSEDTILRVYLTGAYYGWRMNGLRQACVRLGVNMENLKDCDAAGIVSRLKYPEPGIMPERRRVQINIRSRHIIMLYQRHWGEGGSLIDKLNQK